MLKNTCRSAVRSLLTATAMLASVAAGLAHDDKNAAGYSAEHRKTDFGWDGFEELNQRLAEDFRKFDFKAAAAAYSRAMAVPAGADAHINGFWSPVIDIPIVAIHNAVLPNGKILMWDSVGDLPTENYQDHDTTRAMIWDPATGNAQRYDVTTGFNLFCAGHAALPDGRQFIAGGNLDAFLSGLDALHIFNPANSTWTFEGGMTQGGRWYPSVTALANGEMLITAGGPIVPEIFNPLTGVRPLPNAALRMPDYPWLLAAPNGKTAYFGPGSDLSYLDTSGAGSWGSFKNRDGVDRNYGSYASYDIGKVLVAGGGLAVKSSLIVDVSSGSTPRASATGPMETGRRQHNLTVLPNGTVLATGGLSTSAEHVDLTASVYTAELWNPATGQWQTLSSMQRTRQYHSMALLMPDGRVMVGGGGICGQCNRAGYLEKNIEIFSPPYLFKNDGSGDPADRPIIRTAPASVAYRQTFTLSTTSNRPIRQAVLIRPSSVTHSVNFEQRRIPLRVANGNRGLQITGPTDASVAPPGHYMLFILDDQGVPSVAKMVKIG